MPIAKFIIISLLDRANMKNNRKTKEPFIENYEICECLKELFEAELRLGNKVRSYDPTASWPHPDTTFLFLEDELKTKPENLKYAQNISHQICRDLHYGWHDECLCRVHHDLLCAGHTRPHH